MRFTSLLFALGAAAAAAAATIQSTPRDPVAEVAQEVFEGALRDVHASALEGDLRARRRPIDDPWVVRTEHYEVHASRDRQLAAWVARSLEVQLAAMQRFLDTDRAPDERFRVTVFPDLAAYNALGEDYDARSSIAGAFYANSPPHDFVATYESDNYNVMLENLVYGAFLQYADSLAPGRGVATALDQAMASFFAANANPELARFRFEQFVAIRDEADGAAPWTSVGALLLMGLDGFASNEGAAGATLGRARRTQLAQLVTFLTQHHPDTSGDGDGPGMFQDYVAKTYTGQNATEHPFLTSFLTPQELQVLDGALREYRGWDGE